MEFVRGDSKGVEYKRDDTSFYKGVVVKNNDPLKIHRVKIYIPEISNQPLEDWLQEYKTLNIRFPGINNVEDVWSDTKIFEQISKFLPWAEPCSPLFGEGAPARYQSPEQLAVITDSNDTQSFEQNNEENPTLGEGSYGPAYLYENYETAVGDAFQSANTLCKEINPYAFQYRPSKHVNKSKGIFSVPSIGSKVWVFHYHGDLNFPVYFGLRHDYRETVLINNMDNKIQQSLDYPGVFENLPKHAE